MTLLLPTTKMKGKLAHSAVLLGQQAVLLLLVAFPRPVAGQPRPVVPGLTPLQFIQQPMIVAIWGGCFAICFLRGLFVLLQRIFPRGLNVLRDLELDDTPDQRFDGIENALYDRFKDPFSYITIPTIRLPRLPERTEEDVKRDETRASILEAANLLRTVRNGKDKKDGEERPASSVVLAAGGGLNANSTALASSTAIRRGSNASVLAGADNNNSGNDNNKWNAWNDIADGRSNGFVGTASTQQQAQALNSARSESSVGSSYSVLSTNSLFGRPANSATLQPTDARFGGRQSAPAPTEGSTPKAGGAGGSQWSSRSESGSPSKPPKPELALDLSKVKVAPPSIKPPKPIPQQQQQQRESLKFKFSDEASEGDSEAYSMDLPVLHTNPALAAAQQMQRVSGAPPPRLPVRLGPPVLGPPGLGYPPSSRPGGAQGMQAPPGFPLVTGPRGFPSPSPSPSPFPRGPVGMAGPGGRAPPAPRGPPPAAAVVGAAGLNYAPRPSPRGPPPGSSTPGTIPRGFQYPVGVMPPPR